MRKVAIAVLATAVCCGLASSASADWIAYNDLISPYGGATQTTIGENGSGELIKSSDGSGTGVTFTHTDTDNFVDYTGQGYWYEGASWWSPDTDGYNMFTLANVSAEGIESYPASSNWSSDYTFSGLDPAKKYRVALSACRASSSTSYQARFTGHDIVNPDGSQTYASSSVSPHEAANPDGWSPYIRKNSETSVSINYAQQQQKWWNGYVASWTEIDPGADGAFMVHTYPDGNIYGEWRKAYMPVVLLLEELPPPIAEPAGLGLIGVALLGLRRRRS